MASRAYFTSSNCKKRSSSSRIQFISHHHSFISPHIVWVIPDDSRRHWLGCKIYKASQCNFENQTESIPQKNNFLLCTTTRCPQIENRTPAILPSHHTTKPKRVASRVTRGYLPNWTRPSRYAVPVLYSKRDRLTSIQQNMPSKSGLFGGGFTASSQSQRAQDSQRRGSRQAYMFDESEMPEE